MGFVSKAVSSVFGGGSSDTPKYEDKASEVTWDMFKRSMAEARPYTDAGKAALPGYVNKVNNGVQGWWTGQNYHDQISGLSGEFGGLSQPPTQLPGPDAGMEDIFGPEGKYGVEGLQDDPTFQWRLKTLQDELNKSLVGEGKLYSSMAPEKYGNVINSLTADEADKAYGRQTDAYNRAYARDIDSYGRAYQHQADSYGRQSDSYNRQLSEIATTYGMGQTEQQNEYTRMLDLIKVGTGASAQAGQYAAQAGQNLGGLYSNLSQTAAQERANSQGLMSDLVGTGVGLYAMSGWLGG